MNPEDNRRLTINPYVEIELTADVCPTGPARDAGDQGRDGRIGYACSRPEPARQIRRRSRGSGSGHRRNLAATADCRRNATTP